MRLMYALGGFGVALCLSACADKAAIELEPSSKPQSAQIVVDFRAGPQMPAAGRAAASTNIAEKVFGSPAPADVSVASVVTGRFTAPTNEQSVALLTRGGSVIAQANAKPSMLVVLENQRIAAQFVPPDIVYHSIAAVFDADGDALEDVVLTALSYQMGQTIMRADILSLAGGQRRTIRALGSVYENACDAPFGEKVVRASLLRRQANGELKLEKHTAPCTSDGATPTAESFTLQSPDKP